MPLTRRFGGHPATATSGGRVDEPNARDLRGNTEAVGWTPITRTPAHIDPETLQAVQTRGERLEVAHEMIPRPELAAVRVPGELHVESGARSPRCGARLEGEEDFRR